MLSRGEKVVYPGHGVAKISRIIEKKIAGSSASFFELKFLSKDMTILVPVANAESVGIRLLSTHEQIEEIFELISDPFVEVNPGDVVATNWNKRNKEYQGKLRTGNLHEIGEIYRDLKNIERHKELSFGEKALLSQTELLLVEEISLIKNIPEGKVVELLRALIKPVLPHGVAQVVQKNL